MVYSTESHEAQVKQVGLLEVTSYRGTRLCSLRANGAANHARGDGVTTFMSETCSNGARNFYWRAAVALGSEETEVSSGIQRRKVSVASLGTKSPRS